MVNTRAKSRKLQNIRKICFTQASITDLEGLMTQSGALVGSNDELLTEILCRLPITSVLRFKSVSKHWRSLLSHRHFTLLYDKVLRSPGFFVRNMYIPFDVENKSPPPFRSLDFYPDFNAITILQSCNGLLLCCSDQAHARARNYYVFNPTTKQFAIIPSVPGGKDARKTIHFMGLASHNAGCGHYKVVCIRCANPDRDLYQNPMSSELFQIQIYSSDTRTWRISNESFSAPYLTPFHCGVYWNGAVHWAPSRFDLMYFKLDVEQVHKLRSPEKLKTLFYFGESRDHLHMVGTVNHESYLHLNVYEMSSDHSGWRIKYQAELDELPVAYPEMIRSNQHPSSPHYYEFDVLDVVRGELEENTFMVVWIPGKIIRYNVVDKSFKQIFDLTNVFYGHIGFLEAHRYTETLTSF
ncbi:F-box protein-like protein [Tanacetum coccineum]